MSAISSPASAPVRTPEHKPVLVPPTRRPARRWVIPAVVVVVIAAGILAYRLVPQRTPASVAAIKTAKVFVGPLDIKLRVSGQTSARNFATVTAPQLRGPESRGSLVLTQLAAAGSFVKKGDLVATLDAQSLKDHIDDLADTVHAAANDVQKREAEQKVEWEDMQQNLRVAKADLDKAKLDYSAGEVKTEIERELLKLEMDEAQARYNELLKDVEFRRQSQAAELQILRLTLKRHQAHMARHTNDLAKFTIYAPMSGLVAMSTLRRGSEMAQIQLGDQVWPGMSIMKIVDTSSMQVEASVSQSDSSLLRMSQPVTIGLDAFPNLKFAGKVYSIGALAVSASRENYYIRNVPVMVAIQGSDPRLIPDLSAYGDVLLESVPNQVQAPLAAVHERNGKATVQVKAGDQWEIRPVTLGKRNKMFVAIASGLKPGEEVRID
jgi:HlyD family secretion protein